MIKKCRIGLFFFLIGLVLWVIFFGSDQSQNPEVVYFFGGVFLGGLGIYLMWKDRKPPSDSKRFRLFRESRLKHAEKKERVEGKK